MILQHEHAQNQQEKNGHEMTKGVQVGMQAV